MEHNGKHYYKVDVAGKHGYSFMVYSAYELDECEVISLCLDADLFEDENDAPYAVVDDLVSVSDVEHFQKCECIFNID